MSEEYLAPSCDGHIMSQPETAEFYLRDDYVCWVYPGGNRARLITDKDGKVVGFKEDED